MEQRPDIKFFRSYYDAAKMLPDKETQADYLMALLRYAFDDELPSSNGVATAMFLLVKPNLDKSLKLADAGRRGGQVSGKGDASLPEALPKGDASQSQPEIGSMDIGSMDIGSKEDISPPISPQGDDAKKPKQTVYPAGFVEFWEAYPKKVGKAAAAKSFERALKTVDLQTILNAVEAQKHGAQWNRDGGQYIPNPATWLNQGRWDDEVREQGPVMNKAAQDFTAGMNLIKEWMNND